MSNVVEFKRPSKSKQKEKKKDKAKGKTLCGSGFHKWKIETENKFDVKLGKLVTVSVCERCGEKKHELK